MEEVLVIGLFGGTAAAALSFGIAWLGARSRADRLEALLMRPVTPRSGDDQLEARVNELAEQVQELARSQDFLHKMIRHRLDRLPPAREEAREVTPH